jgi:FlaA1/EpsC-like NDP-sugar epimerase
MINAAGGSKHQAGGKLSFLNPVFQIMREQQLGVKIAISGLVDFVLLVAVVASAFMARVSDFRLPDQSVLPLYLVAPLLSVFFLFVMRIYSAAVRNHSNVNELRIVYSQLLAAMAWVVILYIYGVSGFARSVVGIYLAFAIIGLIVLRRFASYLLQETAAIGPSRSRIPVLIYGAGPEGSRLAENLLRQGRYEPVAFMDIDQTRIGRTVNRFRVFSTTDLDKAVRKYQPQEVLIAKPGITRSALRELVDMLMEKGLRVNVVPDLDDMVDSKTVIGQVKPINVEDLLGRDPVPPDRDLMEKAVKGRRVLVTGAGGSIGSEIVRQVASYWPESIVLYEKSEFALFEIHREIENRFSAEQVTCKLVPVLADIMNRKDIAKVLKREGIEVVFHAAAYKHVRMIQENPEAGIRTNVFGTQTVVEEAISAKVKLFVLISTDKAVRPTSVMGASKRVAEMIVQAAAKEGNSKTSFAIVRFGNVLGSSGSVVPLFREQIASGGPVQITHAEATRYFMLIPEAAQLVVQASALADNGEVLVLDMGEPVRIQLMAEAMIELAGLTVRSSDNLDGDIDIKYIGLRDGEKLHEELQIGNDIRQTSHPRIMKSNETLLQQKHLDAALRKLNEILPNPNSASKLIVEIANQ